MIRYVVNLSELDRTDVALAGAKGAHLGALARIDGVRVPAGFCVTTDAFVRAMAELPVIGGLLDELSRVTADDRTGIQALSADARRAIEGITMPADIATAIDDALSRLGEDTPCAVRSSATAEDMPSASFAGQQDSYLNVAGRAVILLHVKRCWASLFTDRAVTYRLRNGFDHRSVRMAVVVQRMVFPRASGVLFTADPVTGNRKVASVDATLGLGEALVSGRVNADSYHVRDGRVTSRTIASKFVATIASPGGGTHDAAIDADARLRPALGDDEVVRLVQLGRRIEAHFGSPQDIEWCLAGDDFHIVQSRPVTTLFPVPDAPDAGNHVYVSVGHQQMMTDPMKPLGLSIWQMTTPRPMAEAGGRLFVDVTQALASAASRGSLLATLGKSDPLITDALQSVLDRGDFIPSVTSDALPWTPPGAGSSALETDPAIVADLIARGAAWVSALERDIEGKSGAELLDFIAASIEDQKRVQLDPRSLQVIMAGMEAALWLNDRMQEWLGERNVADTLTQSVPNNVTSEMGLSLLDVADVIRAHPAVVSFLERGAGDDFLDELPQVDGGGEARDAIVGWLDRYGMRGAGEIDITRPRWRERPSMLLPVLLGNVRNFEPGAATRRFEEGRLAAARKEAELLERVRTLPDGEQKAGDTKRMADRVRTFAGYREYPKYRMVGRYFVYKQALLQEADRLVAAHVLREREDVFWLRFEELREVVRSGRVDGALIRGRKEAYRGYEALRARRVLTSEGEGLSGSHGRSGMPPGALVGLAVSSGTVEGRARVILDMARADLERGDILVTAYTDPSWTPLFVSIAGLVTEVGGLTTHGAVIAREYGLPAVVGVENATRAIRDGQRIRVHGTEGYVEVLDA